ncbi:phagocyte signaling-impaired protein [Onthophagus taurus]|uniref:phagocyte signaling-impaired protein n=1 Tax=Onthophagus taurus TaxID=166361 RepID=UPI0039BDFAD7
MSTSKLTHVRDTSIMERRLRPIYDWLDNGMHKKALQECDKVLKKTPYLQCAKALKAVALLRLGKAGDSKVILEALVNECPTDDATLQAISICYKESNEFENICKLYEAALKVDKTSEELYTHLFMSYVRVNNFKEQQRVAMALYKLKPRSPYYTWAVMSNVLQATRSYDDSKDDQKRSLLLNLAERMMVKLLDKQNKSAEGEHEGHLYVHILDLQGKYQEILTFLTTPLGDKLLNGAIQFDRLRFFVKLKRWKKVNVYCKQILNESIDKWNIWMEYLNSVFELMKESSENKRDKKIEDGGEIVENGNNGENSTGNGEIEVTADDSPEKAHEFICSLIENGFNGYAQRGPYLARIELCQRLHQRLTASTNITSNVINDLLGEPAQLFVEYFRLFGHKPCCVSDLRSYLNILNSEERALLCENLLKDLNVASNSIATTMDQMQRHISAIQLSRLSGTYQHLEPETLYEIANILTGHYNLGYERYGKDLLVTDQGPSDPYGLVASHILYDIGMKTQSSEPLICALVVLENLLKNSKSCFHAKLLCVKLYHQLGGGSCAHSMYESLDLKHIQLDSLGYVHCSRLPTTGLFTIASQLYETTIKFFVANYRDSSDHLTFVYKYGSFGKIDEFMDFREKLYNSLHYTQVVMDRIVLTLMQSASLDGLTEADLTIKERKIDWEAACDNSDLSVYLSWDPERIENPPEKWDCVKLRVKQNQIFAEIRSLMVNCFSIAFKTARISETSVEKSPHLEELKSTLKSWENLNSQHSNLTHLNVTERFVSLPLKSRLISYFKVPYFEVLGEFFAVFIYFSSGKESEMDANVLERIEKYHETILTSIKDLIRAEIASDDVYFSRSTTIEILVNFVELLTLCAFVLTLCNETLKVKTKNKSKNKNKIDSNSSLKGKEILSGLVSNQINVLNETVLCLDGWCAKEFSLEMLEKQIEGLRIDKTTFTGVISKLEASLQNALRELKAVLNLKCKVLMGLI